MAIIGDNYVFIHIHKTGGKSVRFYLGKPEDTYGRHVEAKQIKPIVDDWDSKFKFSFVRNPYDWISSLYYYILHARNHPEQEIAKRGFKYFVKWLVEKGMWMDKAPDQNKYLTQTGFLEIDGKIDMDYVGRLENFYPDIKHILKQIGHPHTKEWRVNVNPFHKESPYDNGTKRIIQRVFEEDFENFGYEY